MRAILKQGSQYLWILLPLLLGGCQMGDRSLLPDKEGYYTWVDANGHLHATQIQSSGNKAPVLGLEADGDQGHPGAAAARPQNAAVPSSSPSAAPVNQSGKSDASTGQGSGVAPAKKAAGKNQPTGRDDDSEYTLANYPDAEALEKSGYIRPGDPLPYFTWQDSQGRIRVSYYRPDTRSDVEKGLVRQPIELTDASVYTADSDHASMKTPPLANGKVPEAFRVLGIDPDEGSLFQQWQALCCSDLTIGQFRKWSADREFQLDVDADSPTHRFSTGVSHYRLVQLPSTSPPGGFVLRVRSFDDHGVYVPSLAFLNQDLETQRLVTDLVMAFQPESWHRQGYLEAFVPVFPARGERWLMVFTRAEDLASQTVIETGHGPRRIPHEPTGTLSLTGMQP